MDSTKALDDAEIELKKDDEGKVHTYVAIILCQNISLIIRM